MYSTVYARAATSNKPRADASSIASVAYSRTRSWRRRELVDVRRLLVEPSAQLVAERLGQIERAPRGDDRIGHASGAHVGRRQRAEHRNPQRRREALVARVRFEQLEAVAFLAHQLDGVPVHERDPQLGIARALDRRGEAALGDVEAPAVRVEHRADPDQRGVLAALLLGDGFDRGGQRLARAALEQADAAAFDHANDSVDRADLCVHASAAASPPGRRSSSSAPATCAAYHSAAPARRSSRSRKSRNKSW